jgi:hypothetical protein
MEHYKISLLLAGKKRYEITVQNKNNLTTEAQNFINTYKDKLITNGNEKNDEFFVALFQYLEKN